MIASTIRPIDTVLERLPGHRANGRDRFMARCPAHSDRLASLSIAEGRDGRVLLRCFAGCATGAIADALGMPVAALFPPRDEREQEARFARETSLRRAFRIAPRSTINAFELREVERQRGRRLRDDPSDTPHVRGCDITAARRRASQIFGIPRPPAAPRLWEGWGCEDDRDPLWPALFEMAVRQAALLYLDEPVGPHELRARGRADLVALGARRAHFMLREIARLEVDHVMA